MQFVPKIMFIDIACSQKKKYNQNAYGDFFASNRFPNMNRVVAGVSDGLGSGIKANILACMTSTMLLKFMENHSDIEKSCEIKVLRTICTATDQRQAAAMELAAKVDMMLVIGGKNSANTTRLAQLCADKCRTYHIETAAELQDEWFDKIEKIGITAGASTPDWIIKEVYIKCQNR